MERQKALLASVGILFIASLIVLAVVVTGNEIKRGYHAGLDETRSIEVQGEGEVEIVPDVVEASFSVRTEGDTEEEALDENNERTEGVLEYLKEEGVEEENLQTAGFDVGPLYREIETEDREREREVYAYEARNVVEAEFEEMEMDEIGRLVDGAVRAGANEVRGLNFKVSDEEEYEKEARDEAIKDAREKAERVASSLDVSLGRVLDFSEERGFYRAPVMEDVAQEAADEMEEEGEVPLEPGEDEITSQVRVEYEIR